MKNLSPLLAIILAAALWSAGLPALADEGLRLDKPVPGRVVQAFDPGPTRYSAGHRGVDLEAGPGERVRAAAPGVVHFAGMVAGRPSVSVDHGNGLRTTYTPVAALVTQGEVIATGTVIGTVQSGHCVLAACLHWGLTDGEDYYDPLHYTTERVIRLLPRGSEPAAPVPLPAARLPAPTLGSAPVEGRITSRYGMRTHPITGVRKLHDGMDFGVSCGTPITLPWAGTVRSAGWAGGYGYRVIVEHDAGLRTGYAHLPRVELRAGQRLEAGSAVGVVGSTGYSTGCHLHWMAWRDGELIDPEGLLEGR